MKKLLALFLLLASLAQGQQTTKLPTSFDYTKRAADGRLYQLPTKSKDTLWLKVRADGHVVSERAPQPWPHFPVSVKIDINREAGTFNAQGLPALPGITYTYQVDDGEIKSFIWQQPINPGVHRIKVTFAKPGYQGYFFFDSFLMPSPPVVPPAPTPGPVEPGKITPTPRPKPDENQIGAFRYLTRPQPTGGLPYAPKLEIPDKKNGLGLEDLPDVAPLKGFKTLWFGDATPEEQLVLLRKGVTHVDDHVFNRYNDDRKLIGPQRIGWTVPYARRCRLLYNNAVAETEGGRRWLGTDRDPYRGGRLPLLNQLGPMVRHVADWVGYGNYADGLSPEIVVLNPESDIEEGGDKAAWQSVKKSFLDELSARRGQGPYPKNQKVFFNGSHLHSSWQRAQDYVDAGMYLKMNLWKRSPDWHIADYDEAPEAYRDFHERQGIWADQTIGNVEYLRAKGEKPALSLVAPYHEEIQGGVRRRNHDALPTYKLRPDVAENMPVLLALVGSEGWGIWQSIQGDWEWRTSERLLLAGLNRLSAYGHILDGNQKPVVPEFSLDGRRTWIRQRQGLEWKGQRFNLSDDVIGAVDVDPTLRVPALADRLRFRALENGPYRLIGGFDPWQTDPSATLDVWVRIGAFETPLRLTGRELTVVDQ